MKCGVTRGATYQRRRQHQQPLPSPAQPKDNLHPTVSILCYSENLVRSQTIDMRNPEHLPTALHSQPKDSQLRSIHDRRWISFDLGEDSRIPDLQLVDLSDRRLLAEPLPSWFCSPETRLECRHGVGVGGPVNGMREGFGKVVGGGKDFETARGRGSVSILGSREGTGNAQDKNISPERLVVDKYC
jgi:hypothetical protein